MTTSLTPDQERRLFAKRNNERVKLIVTSLNAVALAILGAAFLVPALANPAVLLSSGPWALVLIALTLYFGAHAVLQFLRSEE